MGLISEHDNTMDDDEQLVQESKACAGYRDLNQVGSESLAEATSSHDGEADDKAHDMADERSDATASSTSAAAASTSASAASAAPSLSGSEAQETSSAATSPAQEESELLRVLRQRRDRTESTAKAEDDQGCQATLIHRGESSQEAALSAGPAAQEAPQTHSAGNASAQEGAIASKATPAAGPVSEGMGSASSCAEPAAASSAGPESPIDASLNSDTGQKLPKVPQGCIDCILDASAKEERAMVFDRAGAYPGAVNLYREPRTASAAILSQALRLCPESHPDHSKIEKHIKEVLDRAAYLYSLGVEPADIPLEQHIHGAALSMTSTKSMQTTAAATVVGAAAGLVLMGPVAGVALAAGAAYATTRQDGVGKVARGVGEAGLGAVDTAKKLNDKVRLDQKIDKTARAVDGRLQISDKAQRAKEAIQAVDEKYSVARRCEETRQTTNKFLKDMDGIVGLSRGVDAAAAKTKKAATEFNAKHQVTEKLNESVSRAGSAVNEGVARAGSVVNEGVARAGSAVTGWVSKLAGSGRALQMSATSQHTQEPLG